MALSDYKAKRSVITVDDEFSFEVRGITPTDVAHLFEFHIDEITEIYVRLRSAHATMQPGETTISSDIAFDIIKGVIQSSPSLVAMLIALASDDMSAYGTARELPVPVQVDALVAIGNLTFHDMAGAKKFLAVTLNLLRSLLPSSLEIVTADTNGRDASTGVYAETPTS